MDFHGYAYFVERPRRLEDLLRPHLIEWERPYSIVTAVQLPEIDYENFITDMLADRKFIEDYGKRCKAGDVWDCLLVLPEQDWFVSWAAYVPGI